MVEEPTRLQQWGRGPGVWAGQQPNPLPSFALASRQLGDRLLADAEQEVTQRRTHWLRAGDGLTAHGTLVSVLQGIERLMNTAQITHVPGLRFTASADGLEDLGRQITEHDGYQSMLSRVLAQENVAAHFDFVPHLCSTHR